MALIDYVDPTAVDGRVRELLERDTDEAGDPSLFALAVANNPDVFNARTEYHSALLQDGSIDTRTGELVYLVVSVTNDCEYCIASHRTALVERSGLPSEDVEAVVRGDYSRFPPDEQAALEFAKEVARDPKGINETHLKTLKEAGFDEAEIIRLLLIGTAAISANAIADTLDLTPADKAD